MHASRSSLRTRPSRTGLTLMEVLIAIFIMAIGMLALLTLFPLGALRMDQAIRDERSAQAAMQAIEYAKILDLANDPAVRAAMVDSNLTSVPPIPIAIPNSNPPATSNGPSKAVLVDPFGAAPYLDPATLNLARVPSNYATNVNDVNHPSNYEYFTLTDDIVFQIGAGIPRQFGTGMGREIRFTWSYLLQQPQVQNIGITNYTVCVYNRRPLAGTLEFTIPNATLNLATNTISYVVTDPSTVKPILPGQWVLDATIVKGPAPNAGSAQVNVNLPLANFYRIVNVRAGSTSAETVLELQSPIRGYPAGTSTYSATGVAAANAPVLIIQDSLVEVIDVGPLR
jgi:type II secretory pathway pseudopilin PulG